jgi:uncharacterized protein
MPPLRHFSLVRSIARYNVRNLDCFRAFGENRMLRHTFCHLPKVGEKTERRLWDAGLTTWQSILDHGASLPPAARRLPAEELRASAEHFNRGNLAWFAGRLSAAHSWRLFSDFRHSCAYIDIETTGMGWSDHITTIALYDGRTVRTYIHGRNLDDFVRDVASYRLLVTYNGKSFDVPVIERCLRCRLDQAHIDLRYVLAGIGLKGGLKCCERLVGLHRPGMEEIDGFVAVLLWHEFRRRQDPKTLETLLAYNVQDTVNLEALMVHAHNQKLASLTDVPFAPDYRLATSQVPVNPFRVDPETVRRVLRAQGWGVGMGGGTRFQQFQPRRG